MRNYSIKLILFLVAFAIGTITAILFWQGKVTETESQPTASFSQENEPAQLHTNQLSPIISLSFNGETYGCRDFVIYKSNEDKTKVIAVRVNKEALKLGQTPRTYKIENNKNIVVVIYDFGKRQYEGYEKLCYDRISPLEPTELIATSGNITVSISKPTGYKDYDATIILENVSFNIPNQNTLILKILEMKNIKVGWYLG